MSQQQQQQRQQQRRQRKKKENETNAYLHSLLPNLKTPMSYIQCVSFSYNNDNELLICGGSGNNDCYSYHIQEQQYQWICSYPQDVVLREHTVVMIDVNLFDINIHQGILLSFGGSKGASIPFHTLIMKYESVWTSSDENKKKKNQEMKKNEFYSNYLHNSESNRWIPIPRNNNNNNNNDNKNKDNDNNDNNDNNNDDDNKRYDKNNIKFGEIQEHGLIGARASIGGSKKHLLFITRYLQDIDVVDLQTFQYLDNIQNTTIPVPHTNILESHCFVPMKIGSLNEFILISNGETILIRYQEMDQQFLYEKLSMHPNLRMLNDSAFACANNHIFIFSRYEVVSTEDIWIFDMQEKIWKEYHKILPSIKGAFAITTESDSAIHILGGIDSNYEKQSTHYVISTLTEQKIDIVLEHWVQNSQINMGWIDEFYDIIIDYINPIE